MFKSGNKISPAAAPRRNEEPSNAFRRAVAPLREKSSFETEQPSRSITNA